MKIREVEINKNYKNVINTISELKTLLNLFVFLVFFPKNLNFIDWFM